MPRPRHPPRYADGRTSSVGSVSGALLSPELQAERLEFVHNDVNFPYGLGIGIGRVTTLSPSS